MIVDNTPLEHVPWARLFVKREDLSCPHPGPPFSKTRGVFAHIAKRPEKIIGVLDTDHSQAGHAVALACRQLGKACVNFYPVRKANRDQPPKHQQWMAEQLGARLEPLPATASWALYHQARAKLPVGAYMMPNALKLPETVEETAAEFARTKLPADVDTIIIAVSSGTIAAGVLRGMCQTRWPGKNLVLHLGYSRPKAKVLDYVLEKSGAMNGDLPGGASDYDIFVVDEQYAYSDRADKRHGTVAPPPWPCNPYYDLKTFFWWMRTGCDIYDRAVMWNVG